MAKMEFKKWVSILFIVFVLSSVFPGYATPKILSPEEAFPLVRRIAEQAMSKTYWGVWEIKNYGLRKHEFYEVFCYENLGFGWKKLGNQEVFHASMGGYRYVFDLVAQEVKGVYPSYGLSFSPLKEEDVNLILENYLIDFQNNRLFLFSRYNGMIVSSFEFDEEGFLLSHFSYFPDGKVRKEGRFIYRDFSPEYGQLSPYFELMERFAESGRETMDIATAERKRIFLPRLLPPGFDLRRVYVAKSGGNQFYYLLYSDGLQYFLITQSAYPRVSSPSLSLRPILVQREEENVVLVGEKEGFYLSFMGNVDPEIGSQILRSLEREGGF